MTNAMRHGMHLPTFFNWLRRSPFGGRLSPSQVSGIEDLLLEWDVSGTGNDSHLAYILATNFHETGGRMQPVREGFAKTDAGARRVVRNRSYGKVVAGHVWYGRGDVQLTWQENFIRMGRILGIPLGTNPDLALDPKTSKRILVEGMTSGVSNDGDFTGKALEDYTDASGNVDFVGARRIVNGTDKDELIAGYAEQCLAAIGAGREAHEGERAVEVAPAQGAPTVAGVPLDSVSGGGILGLAASAVGVVQQVLSGVDNPYQLGAFVVIAIGAVAVISGRIEIKYRSGA